MIKNSLSCKYEGKKEALAVNMMIKKPSLSCKYDDKKT